MLLDSAVGSTVLIHWAFRVPHWSLVALERSSEGDPNVSTCRARYRSSGRGAGEAHLGGGL